MRRALTLLVPTALAAVALVSSGCGVNVDPVAAAATETAKVSTMRVAMRMTLALPTGSVTIQAKGEADLAASRIAMTMDYGPLLAQLGKTGDATMRMVLDGTTMYMAMPSAFGAVPGGKHWVSIDLESVGKQAGVDLAALRQGNQLDPTSGLALLHQLHGATVLDHVRVGGVPTTHYAALVDLADVVDKLPESSRAGWRQLAEMLKAKTGQASFPTQVWVDAQGHVRRVLEDIPDVTGTGASSVRIDYFAFGRPVHISLPDPADVADVGALG